jgi:NTP pyrophosphatase (non-canonical NTP hydrolase)
MTLDEYQEAARSTAIYPNQGSNPIYPTLGLCGEAGEVAEKMKKIMRDGDGKITPEKAIELRKEIGDVLWYIANLSWEVGYTLEEVGAENIAKLKSRQERSKLHGSGDNR